MLPETLPALTEHTITDREKLIEELHAVREQGIAVDREENTLGLRCFGVAIPYRTPAARRDQLLGAGGAPDPRARADGEGRAVRRPRPADPGHAQALTHKPSDRRPRLPRAAGAGASSRGAPSAGRDKDLLMRIH